MTTSSPRIAALLVVFACASFVSLTASPLAHGGDDPQKTSKPNVDDPLDPAVLKAEAKAFEAWQKVYHLEPKQVVKRIAPPFIPERLAGAERKMPFLKKNRDQRGVVSTVIYFMNDDAIENTSITFGGNPDQVGGRQLLPLIHGIAGIPAQDIEGPAELLEKEITGDFLVRKGAPTEDIVAGLEAILWLECDLKISLKLREVDREVVVARGRFKFKPRVEGRQEIDIYGETIGGGAGGGSGKFAEFLDWAGEFIEPKRRIVDEVDERPNGSISWTLNARSPFTEAERLADHDSEIVLKHLEEQTGLTFTLAKRKVRTLFIEKAK